MDAGLMFDSVAPEPVEDSGPGSAVLILLKKVQC